MTDKFGAVLQDRVEAMRASFEEKMLRIDHVQMGLKEMEEQTNELKSQLAKLEKPEINQLKIAELNYLIGTILNISELIVIIVY